MFEGLLIGGVVRDQTQFRISRLRAELLGLRSEEKRLSERRDEVEFKRREAGRRCASVSAGRR